MLKAVSFTFSVEVRQHEKSTPPLVVAVVTNMSYEPGALVLGAGGIVCIDEFDKMSDKDRQAKFH